MLGELYPPPQMFAINAVIHTSNGTCGTAFDNNLTPLYYY